MPQRRPNLLLITTDQQRADALSLNGSSTLATPNLDYLGTSGSNFRHAYAECPSCIPARRTLISGQAPTTHGMVGFYDNVAWDLQHSLPGELAAAGYQTQLVGKLHLSPPRKRYGFDHMIWADNHGPGQDYDEWLHEQGVIHERPGTAHGVSSNAWVGRPSHLDERFSMTTWCVNEALNFVRRRELDTPFFLQVSFLDPHPPLTPPQIYWERYIDASLPEPVVGDWAAKPTGLATTDPDGSEIHLHPDDLHRCRAGYYGLVNHVDDQVGRLLKVIREWGVLDDTLVLFTSDHGEMLGDHNLFRKTWPYEASASIPLLARAPEWMQCSSGHQAAEVVGLQDVMPTLLDAAGVDIPDSVDGRSLLPLMRGEQITWRKYLHGEHTGSYKADHGNQWLSDGHKKYVWHTQTGQEQFFDLANDPMEMHDAALDDDRQDDLATWRRRLVNELRDRPEGYVEVDKLVAGRRPMRPEELRPDVNRALTKVGV